MKVSFIVPVFNKKEYLRQCTESILRQTDADLEVILVDDGSSDGAEALCDRLAAEYPAVQVIHQPNRGVSAARNAGMKRAKGNWIAFVDGDDWIDVHYVETFGPYMKDDVDICMGEEFAGGADRRQEQTERVEEIHRTELEAYERKLLNKYALRTGVHVTSACGKLYRRTFLEKYHLEFAETLPKSEDAFFNQQAYYYAAKAVYCRVPVYYYRQSDNSASHRYYPEDIQNYKKHLKLVEEFLRETGRWEKWQPEYAVRTVFHFMYCIMTDYCHADNPNSFRKRKQAFEQGLQESPFQQAFAGVSSHSFSWPEKVLFFCVKHRWFGCIQCLCRARQRGNKNGNKVA